MKHALEMIVQGLRLIADGVAELSDYEPGKPRYEPVQNALLTRDELAKRLKVSVPTIDRLRKQGMPTVWVCDVPRFDLPEVLQWLRKLKGHNDHS